MSVMQIQSVELGSLLPGILTQDGAAHLPVRALRLDSREVEKGDLFLAVTGWQQDARNFIPQAVASGCVAVIAEARNFDGLFPAHSAVVKCLERAGVPLILITDLQSQVSSIAANYYGHPGKTMDIMGVTGTNGKTTCTLLIAQIASLLGDTCGVIGTLGWGVVTRGLPRLSDTGMTTPDAVSLQALILQLRQAGVAKLAMEVSSHSLDQGRVNEADINCGIYTNLTRDHLDYHGSEENYAAAKALLFTLPSVRQAIVNIDDAYGAEIYAGLRSDIEAISYGLSAGADVRADEVVLTEEGLSFRIRSPWGEGLVRSKLLGEYNALNLLAAIATFCLRGVTLERLLGLIPSLKPVPGRMEMIVRPNCPRVIVDYAHTPDALRKTLVSLKQHCAGQLWCVFGCGGDRDQGKRSQMGAIAENLADHVIVTSDNPRSEIPGAIIRDILEGMTDCQRVAVHEDRREAIEKAVASADAEDCILVAGKGHENYQQIGNARHPFSDVVVASDIMAKRAALPGGVRE